MNRFAAAVLLLLFAVAALFSLRLDSVTFDETSHIPAGLSYLWTGDLRMNPEHPPLVKTWSAIPAWLFGEDSPDTASPAWRDGNQWEFGFALLNREGDPDRLVIPARSMMVLLGVLLGVVVWRWARDLYGDGGGLLALALYCLSPTMLAHARLVTTDLPAALGYALTLWLFWRYTGHPSLKRAAAVGVALGFALSVKYSSLLLLPVLALLLLVRRPAWKRLGPDAAMASVAAFAVLWAAYGFRYAAVPDGAFALPWDAILERQFSGKGLLQGLRSLHLLPEGYLYGLAYTLGAAAYRLSYFHGKISVTGSPWFFPVAFLLKTPPAVLAMLCWAVVSGAKRSRLKSKAGWFLAIPAAVYLGAAVNGNLNLGHRHLAPLYPLMFVGIGSLAEHWSEKLPRRILTALLALTLVSSILATPGYLSYFNGMAGGPSGAQRWFVDSSLDWGQDLKRLRTWMDDEGVDSVDLAYFGTADPKAYGIQYGKVAMFHDFRPGEPAVRPGPGSWFVISKTLLVGMYLETDREFAVEGLRQQALRRDWIDAWSDRCRTLREAGERTPALADWLVAEGRITAEARERIEAPLLSTWIGDLRETREPDARIGDSLLAFRIPGP